MNYNILQQIIDLLQLIIIVGLIIQNVFINKEIKDLKIRLKTMIKTDRWVQNMQFTSIKKSKDSGQKQEK